MTPAAIITIAMTRVSRNPIPARTIIITVVAAVPVSLSLSLSVVSQMSVSLEHSVSERTYSESNSP